MFLKEVLLKILLYTWEIFSPAAPTRVPKVPRTPEFWSSHFQGLSIARSGFLFFKGVALLYQPMSTKVGRHCIFQFCPVQGVYWCRRSQKVHQTCHWFWGWINRICLLCHGKVVPLSQTEIGSLAFYSGFFFFFFLSESFNECNVTSRADFSKHLAFPKLVKAALLKSWACVGMSKLGILLA